MELPKYWMIVQQLATVDATTFDMYLANMRTMIMEQLFSADVVYFCCDIDPGFVRNFILPVVFRFETDEGNILHTAEVHVEFAKEYKGKGPVLYPISITPAEKPEDELVYFS